MDKRRRQERRIKDIGPPRNSVERRRNPERRLPKVAEQELSDEDWAAMFGNRTKQDETEELAAQVLDRVRDGR